MLSCSAVISVCTGTNVYALTPNEQLKALKEVFASEFDKMDTNSDGTLSKSEYLRHQFESFRANIMEADKSYYRKWRNSRHIKNKRNNCR